MISIARRNIATSRGRFAFTVGGLAVATLLMAFVLALYQGARDRVAAYVEDVPADIWVVRPGNESFFNPSFLTSGTVTALSTIEGVEDVDTLLVWSVKLRFDEASWDTYVVGFEADGVGGPVEMKRGSAIPGRGEIIVDEVMARRAGVDIGDEVGVGVRTFTVSGIARGGNLLVTQLSFIHSDDARLLIGIDAEGFVNFALVRAAEGRTAETLEALNNYPGVAAYSRDTYAASSRKLLENNLLPILLVVMVLSFGVGSIVVGLTTYSSIAEREREFGVLKALGTPPAGLARIVLEQSLASSLAGFAVGMLLSLLLARATTAMVPQFVTLFALRDTAIVLALACSMSLIASLLPIVRISRIDPLSVFKA
jgi:putative ABC transport system permease protein